MTGERTPSHIQIWTYGALSSTHTALDTDVLALHARGTRVHALHLHFQELVTSALSPRGQFLFLFHIHSCRLMFAAEPR